MDLSKKTDEELKELYNSYFVIKSKTENPSVKFPIDAELKRSLFNGFVDFVQSQYMKGNCFNIAKSLLLIELEKRGLITRFLFNGSLEYSPNFEVVNPLELPKNKRQDDVKSIFFEIQDKFKKGL